MRSVLQLIATCCLFIIISESVNAQTSKKSDSMQYFYQYLKRPLYEFLLNDSVRKYKSIILIQEPPGKLAGVFVTIRSGLYIKIIFSEDSMLSFNQAGFWKFEDVIKEKIFRIYITDKHGNIKTTYKE